MRARALVKSCGIDAAPVDITKFLAAANAELQYSDRLGSGTAGMTIPLGERNLILINEHEAIERQRFTALHEIAHILLDLPSRHDQDVDSGGMFSYVRRPPEEIACDTFAAECLLPHSLLQQDLGDAVAGFEFVSRLADKYQASLACTASRVAINAPFACAYVLSQDGFVRFSTSSPAMRASKFFVTSRIQVPAASITGQCLKAGLRTGSGQVAAHLWTSTDDFEDVDLMEDVRFSGVWNQALTLLWIEDGDLPDLRGQRSIDDRAAEEPLLRELDGVLPWPGRGRRS
ncbi:MAG: ImmA/IrrE family metallo-endopeptidase [Proteobacteria bacterium]|nr:ImmA/IrrE family metallo-endopeptidase [Pseudomonadota bacterium]